MCLLTIIFHQSLFHKNMEKSIRNKKICSLIKREMAKILLLETIEKGRIISISQIQINTNLVNAKLYLRIFPRQDKNKILRTIKKKAVYLRHILGKNLRNQLRTIPVIHFYIDDLLDDLEK